MSATLQAYYRNMILKQSIVDLDSEADESQYDVIRDFKSVILAYQFLKLLRQRNMLTTTNQHAFLTWPGILLNENRCKFRVKCSRYGKRIRVSLIAMHKNPRQVMTEVQTKLLYKYNQTESKTYSMPIIRLGLCLCMQGHILSNPVVFSRPVCPFNTVYLCKFSFDDNNGIFHSYLMS